MEFPSSDSKECRKHGHRNSKKTGVRAQLGRSRKHEHGHASRGRAEEDPKEWANPAMLPTFVFLASDESKTERKRSRRRKIGKPCRSLPDLPSGKQFCKIVRYELSRLLLLFLCRFFSAALSSCGTKVEMDAGIGHDHQLFPTTYCHCFSAASGQGGHEPKSPIHFARRQFGFSGFD